MYSKTRIPGTRFQHLQVQVLVICAKLLTLRAVSSTRVAGLLEPAGAQKSSSFIFELELLYSFKNKFICKFLCLFTSKL